MTQTAEPGTDESVMLVGDTHGNLNWIAAMSATASAHNCRRMVVLGDFGFWTDPQALRSGRIALNDHWISAVNDIVSSDGVHLTVIDGNHDNHPQVRDSYPADPDTYIRPIRSNIEWADRGACWTWAGVRFAAFGGADSIDKHYRIEGISWWPTEIPTYAEMDRLASRGKVDVLLTHEAPASASISKRYPPGDTGGAAVRRMVDMAVAMARPRFLAHSHHHTRYSDVISVDGSGQRTRVEGFGHDGLGDGQSWALLRLPSLELIDGRALTTTPPQPT